MMEGTQILGCPSSEDIISFQGTLNKSYNHSFFAMFYGCFCPLETQQPPDSSDIYKIFPFGHAGEYMMTLSICGCTVPLNMH